MTAEERSTLIGAVTDQAAETERFRSFVSRNHEQAQLNGWSQSDVADWIDEDRREQRSR